MDPTSSAPPAPEAPRLLPGPVELLREAWEVYKRQFWTLVGLVIVSSLIFVVGAVLAILFGALLFGILVAVTQSVIIAGVIVGFVALLFLVGFSYIQIWIQGALLYAIKDNSENIGIREAFARAKGKVLSLWWVGILSFFVVLGGLLLLIVPGIILAFSFVFALWVVVAEDGRGISALARSQDYVRGRFGKVVGRLLFLVLLYIPFYIVSSLVKGEPAVVFVIQIIFILLGILGNVYTFVLYKYVRELRPGAPSSGNTKTKFTVLAILGIVGIILIIVFTFGVIVLLGSNFLNKVNQQGNSTSTSNPLFGGIIYQKGRDARRIADLRQVQYAFELYYQKCGFYPGGPIQNDTCPASFTPRSVALKNADGWSALSNDLVNSGLGIAELPKDSSLNSNYMYGVSKDGQSYTLGTTLEDPQNPAFQDAPATPSNGINCGKPVYCASL